MNPMRREPRVDLPEPDSPTTAVIVGFASSMVRLKSSSATVTFGEKKPLL